MDARNIFFPEGYFDAIFSMNAYLYFGTDDLYLPYLTQFMRGSVRICIAGPVMQKNWDRIRPKNCWKMNHLLTTRPSGGETIFPKRIWSM
jgi:hypothetical protein